MYEYLQINNELTSTLTKLLEDNLTGKNIDIFGLSISVEDKLYQVLFFVVYCGNIILVRKSYSAVI